VTPPHRARVCDSAVATGFYHRLSTNPWTLVARGRLLRFCGWACTVAYVTNMPYEDVRIHAIGMSTAVAASGTG
jgi:hypothetical protein